MKECPNCGEVKSISAFKDHRLKSGVGNICIQCKNSGKSKKIKHRFDTEERRCQKCGKLRPIDQFEDSSLKSGYSVHCKTCRYEQAKEKALAIIEAKKNINYGVLCPRCGSHMVKRTRRSDGHKFYGCSSFPRCKGTISIE
ncbi:MAG: topoisomerase DNA-binding C4 zinc finger domain-containing protein [Chloroflexi bacterium]|nr:topoisomerase DNA-binding C4 zinc finger domain-containing protein [Chloroflexota bacterium]